jgi:hypothetical protein
MKKKRRRTPEEIARSAELHQQLLERVAIREAKLEEAQTGGPVEPKIRMLTREELQERVRYWFAHRAERGDSQTG